MRVLLTLGLVLIFSSASFALENYYWIRGASDTTSSNFYANGTELSQRLFYVGSALQIGEVDSKYASYFDENGVLKSPQVIDPLPEQSQFHIGYYNSAFAGSDSSFSEKQAIIMNNDVTFTRMVYENTATNQNSPTVITSLYTDTDGSVKDYKTILSIINDSVQWQNFFFRNAAKNGYRAELTFDIDVVLDMGTNASSINYGFTIQDNKMNFGTAENNRVLEIRATNYSGSNNLVLFHSDDYSLHTSRPIVNMYAQMINVSGVEMRICHENMTDAIVNFKGTSVNLSNAYIGFRAAVYNCMKEDGGKVMTWDSQYYMGIGNGGTVNLFGENQFGEARLGIWAGGGTLNLNGHSITSLYAVDGSNNFVLDFGMENSRMSAEDMLECGITSDMVSLTGAGKKQVFLVTNDNINTPTTIKNFIAGEDVILTKTAISFDEENYENNKVVFDLSTLGYTADNYGKTDGEWYITQIEGVEYEGEEYYSYTYVIIPEPAVAAALLGLVSLLLGVLKRK